MYQSPRHQVHDDQATERHMGQSSSSAYLLLLASIWSGNVGPKGMPFAKNYLILRKHFVVMPPRDFLEILPIILTFLKADFGAQMKQTLE